MPFPFGKSQKTPAELVRGLKETLSQLEELETSECKKGDKLAEEISKSLASLKEALCGTAEKEPQMEAVAQLAQELYSTNLFISLIGNLQRIDFEGKKDLVQLFNGAVRRQIGARSPTVEYISAHPQIVFMLLRGYESAEAAQSCGAMLRECLHHEPLARIVLFSEDFYRFFHYVALSVFDVASDAFASFKDLLTRHKVMCAEFLETNYNRVFTEYDKLLHSDNYVTKRQSLKLLGELLLDVHNFAIMMEYISQVENLKLMMNMLKDKRRSIQFEAFHVFKIFVANPNKSAPVLDILLKNQSKLLEFLSRFQMDRADDEHFTNEKNYLIKQIKELKRPPSPGDV